MTNAILKTSLQTEINYIQNLIEKNGPTPADYQALDDWHDRVWDNFKDNEQAMKDIRNALGLVYKSVDTLLGLTFLAPHGYKGDFEVIDRIYQKRVSSINYLEKWDAYFHNHLKAPQAVRNRKTYFKNILSHKLNANPSLTVLNLASGPCRDLKEFFETHPTAPVTFDCVELDENAIAYAQKLTNYTPNINFIHKNVFRYATDQQYDLVWSAGLFDYFEDKIFVKILARFLKNVKAGGELIIGNFHPRNPTRSVMEISTWHLHHRTEKELIALAQMAGVADVGRITIDMEGEGINLFMRIRF